MIKNMWEIEDGTIINLPTPPEKIIQKQCEYLAEVTNYEINAKIDSYDGAISSYKKPGLQRMLFEAATLNMHTNLLHDKIVDIQDDLGSIGTRYFTFEFFITSPNIPNYKYRVLFMRYEIGFYPLLVVLDDEIAMDELINNQDVWCGNEEEFLQLLKKVLNSSKVRKVIASLRSMVKSAS